LSHLSAFVHAYSSPQRPALLMGDLNTDGLARDPLTQQLVPSQRYSDLVARLGFPNDLWAVNDPADPDHVGVTFDSNGSFASDSQPRPADDPARYQGGDRLDYCFSWPGIFQPLYRNTRTIIWQSSPGRDISDHYGLRTEQTCVRELEVDVNQPIKGVTVALTGFRCLTETGGPVPVVSEKIGSDEVEFDLRLVTAAGPTETKRTARVEDIVSGSWHSFDNPVTLSVGDPGAALEVQVTGFEVDDSPLGETGRATLGPTMLRLERSELVMLKGQSTTRVPPLLIGDSGEYAVNVTITVT
jgi:hypothetical protein